MVDDAGSSTNVDTISITGGVSTIANETSTTSSKITEVNSESFGISSDNSVLQEATVNSFSNDESIANDRSTSIIETSALSDSEGITNDGSISGIESLVLLDSEAIKNDVGSNAQINSGIISNDESIAQIESITNSNISSITSPILSIGNEEIIKDVAVNSLSGNEKGRAEESGSSTDFTSNDLIEDHGITDDISYLYDAKITSIVEENGIGNEEIIKPLQTNTFSANEAEAIGDDSSPVSATLNGVMEEEGIGQIEDITSTQLINIPTEGHAYAEEETPTDGLDINQVPNEDHGIVEWDGSWTDLYVDSVVEDHGITDDLSKVVQSNILIADTEGEGVGEETDTTGVTRQGVNTIITTTTVPSLILNLTLPLYKDRESNARPLIKANLLSDGTTEFDTYNSGITDIRIISVVQSLVRDVDRLRNSTSESLVATSGIVDIINTTSVESSHLISSPTTSATDKNITLDVNTESISEVISERSTDLTTKRIVTAELLEGERYYTGNKLKIDGDSTIGTKL